MVITKKYLVFPVSDFVKVREIDFYNKDKLLDDIYIKLDYIKLEKGGTNSSYGKAFDKNESFVEVKNNGGKFEYSIFIKDNGNNGTTTITKETDVDQKAIKKGTAPTESQLPKGTGFCTYSNN